MDGYTRERGKCEVCRVYESTFYVHIGRVNFLCCESCSDRVRKVSKAVTRERTRIHVGVVAWCGVEVEMDRCSHKLYNGRCMWCGLVKNVGLHQVASRIRSTPKQDKTIYVACGEFTSEKFGDTSQHIFVSVDGKDWLEAGRKPTKNDYDAVAKMFNLDGKGDMMPITFATNFLKRHARVTKIQEIDCR